MMENEAKCLEDSYEIDYNKIKTVEDCVELIKVILVILSNQRDVPPTTIYKGCPVYEKLKHLAKEDVPFRRE